MSVAPKTGEHGPSWDDVRVMMAEVGAASDKRIDIHMTAAQGVNRSESCVWSVRAWKWGKWGEGTPVAFAIGLWPSHEYRTVPAMLYRLLHELDGKLEALAEAQKQRRGSRLPGM